jgi:ABC-type methionine transport system permease subunit
MMQKIIITLIADVLGAFTGAFFGFWLFAEKDNKERKAKIYQVLFFISLLSSIIYVILILKDIIP